MEKGIKVCPRCGNLAFSVTAHVAQDWVVNHNGDYIETINQCSQVTHEPDDDDVWQCMKCGYDGAGKEFVINDPERIEEVLGNISGSLSEEKPVVEQPMTGETYYGLEDARKRLCDFCEAGECESCMVSRLLDDAYIEARNAGIVGE